VPPAKLLKRNRKILGHWALAVTSFNHGVRGLPRLRPRDAEFTHFAHLFETCEKSHKNSKLGYASSNYYAEFLAVLHAEAYRHLFYGEAPKTFAPPVAFKHVPAGKTPLQMAMEHGVALQEFQFYNPDLMNLNAKLPRGVLIAIPGESDDLATLMGRAGVRGTRHSKNI
jgi:membrane-bound lytic murein transglycosylase D